jgi:hypothetical protein
MRVTTAADEYDPAAQLMQKDEEMFENNPALQFKQ